MVRFIGNRSCAYIDIRMDFDQYYNATDEGKVIIIKNTILKAEKKLEPRVNLIMKVLVEIYRRL